MHPEAISRILGQSDATRRLRDEVARAAPFSSSGLISGPSGTGKERVDVRIVAATNRDLHEEVLAGRFREDLYYRLNVVHLRTTALGERRADIPILADAFLGQLAVEGLPRCMLSPGAIEALSRADWPGNVRQLRNVLEQAAIVNDSDVIAVETLQFVLSAATSDAWARQVGPCDADTAAETDAGDSESAGRGEFASYDAR